MSRTSVRATAACAVATLTPLFGDDPDGQRAPSPTAALDAVGPKRRSRRSVRRSVSAADLHRQGVPSMDSRGSHVRHLTRRLTVLGVLAPTLAGVLAATLASSASAAAPSAAAAPSPVSIALPPNWRPEGIAAHGSRLYVGSLSTGGIFTTDTTARNGRVLSQGGSGRA